MVNEARLVHHVVRDEAQVARVDRDAVRAKHGAHLAHQRRARGLHAQHAPDGHHVVARDLARASRRRGSRPHAREHGSRLCSTVNRLEQRGWVSAARTTLVRLGAAWRHRGSTPCAVASNLEHLMLIAASASRTARRPPALGLQGGDLNELTNLYRNPTISNKSPTLAPASPAGTRTHAGRVHDVGRLPGGREVDAVRLHRQRGARLARRLLHHVAALDACAPGAGGGQK